MDGREEKIAQYLHDIAHDLAIYLRYQVGASAQDIMSDITVLAYEKINKLSSCEYEGFTYWVFNVAKKKVREWKRKPREIPIDFASDDYTLSTDFDSDPTADAYFLKEDKARVISVLERLNQSDKLIYKERYFENLTFHEIAEKHSIPLNTVLSTHRRFLQKLRILLNEQNKL